jgi:hypothetical protein
MYRYQIKKGEESRLFANSRNPGNGTVESDVELFSPYLTLIADNSTSDTMTATKPDLPQAAPVASPPTPNPLQNEQSTNTEASK